MKLINLLIMLCICGCYIEPAESFNKADMLNLSKADGCIMVVAYKVVMLKENWRDKSIKMERKVLVRSIKSLVENYEAEPYRVKRGMRRGMPVWSVYFKIYYESPEFQPEVLGKAVPYSVFCRLTTDDLSKTPKNTKIKPEEIIAI